MCSRANAVVTPATEQKTVQVHVKVFGRCVDERGIINHFHTTVWTVKCSGISGRWAGAGKIPVI